MTTLSAACAPQSTCCRQTCWRRMRETHSSLRPPGSRAGDADRQPSRAAAEMRLGLVEYRTCRRAGLAGMGCMAGAGAPAAPPQLPPCRPKQPPPILAEIADGPATRLWLATAAAAPSHPGRLSKERRGSRITGVWTPHPQPCGCCAAGQVRPLDDPGRRLPTASGRAALRALPASPTGARFCARRQNAHRSLGMMMNAVSKRPALTRLILPSLVSWAAACRPRRLTLRPATSASLPRPPPSRRRPPPSRPYLHWRRPGRARRRRPTPWWSTTSR